MRIVRMCLCEVISVFPHETPCSEHGCDRGKMRYLLAHCSDAIYHDKTGRYPAYRWAWLAKVKRYRVLHKI